MANRDWRTLDFVPVGVEVWTKIDDSRGERNIQTLVFQNNLWWTPDFRTYVYYTPTHWAPL